MSLLRLFGSLFVVCHKAQGNSAFIRDKRPSFPFMIQVFSRQQNNRVFTLSAQDNLSLPGLSKCRKVFLLTALFSNEGTL